MLPATTAQENNKSDFGYIIDRCGIGKALYATTDARKYEDYVVTDAPAPAVVPVPPKA